MHEIELILVLGKATGKLPEGCPFATLMKFRTTLNIQDLVLISEQNRRCGPLDHVF
jgi:hypothetical protein